MTQTTPETPKTENIIVNDFDAIKRRIWREIGGHRTDLILAALRCIIDEVKWDAQRAQLPEIHRQIMEKATDAKA